MTAPTAEEVDQYDSGTGAFVEDEEDIIITLENVSIGARDQIVRQQTSDQLKRQTLTMGYHHGRCNPLPSTWRYPKGATVIQLMNLWLVGNRSEHVPPLAIVGPECVKHFDKKARSYSKMRQVMEVVKQFARAKGVWLAYNKWDGETVTNVKHLG